jgi:hypothetical protein
VASRWFGSETVVLEKATNGNWFKVNSEGSVQHMRLERNWCPVGETRRTIKSIELVKNKLLVHYNIKNWKQPAVEEKVWYRIDELDEEQVVLTRLRKG